MYNDLLNIINPADAHLSLKYPLSFAIGKDILLLGEGPTLEEIRKYNLSPKYLLQFVDFTFDIEAAIKTLKGGKVFGWAPSLKSLSAYEIRLFGFPLLSFYKLGTMKNYLKGLEDNFAFTIKESLLGDKFKYFTQEEIDKMLDEGKVRVVDYVRTSEGREILPIYGIVDEKGEVKSIIFYGMPAFKENLELRRRILERFEAYMKMFEEGGVVTQIIKTTKKIERIKREPKLEVGKVKREKYEEILGALLDVISLSKKDKLSPVEQKQLERAQGILSQEGLTAESLKAVDSHNWSGFIYENAQGNLVRVVFIHSLTDSGKEAERLNRSYGVMKKMEDMYKEEPGAILREVIEVNGKPYICLLYTSPSPRD